VGNMTINAKRSTEFHLPDDLKEWLEAPPTYKTTLRIKGSGNYVPRDER